MAYSTIVSRLQTDVREATGVGTVYDYKRHVTADQEFNELYVRGSQILTDTGFDDNQKWSSATWAISGSQASVTATGANKDLSQLNASFASPLSTGTYLLTFTVVANTLNADAGQVSGICSATDFSFGETGEETTVPITVNTITGNFTLRVKSSNTSGSITIDSISLTRTGKVHYWEISREVDDDQSDYNTLVVTRDVYAIEGWYSLDDSAESEKTFQAEIDSVVLQLHQDRALNGNGHISEPVRKEVNNEMKGGILCHHAKLSVRVIVPQETT